MRDLALHGLVISMMTAVGLDLDVSELRDGWRRWQVLAVGLIANLLVVPLVVLALISGFELAAGLATGMMLVALSPGGPTGPLFSRIARADLALATTLQVSLSIVVLASAPLGIEWVSPGAERPSVLRPMAEMLALLQLLPLTLGITLRSHAPELATRLAKPLGWLANALLLTVIVGLLVTRGHELLDHGLLVHGLFIGLVLAPIGLAQLGPAERRPSWLAAGLVTSVRNVSIALLLSSSFYAADPSVDTAILVWAFYMMLLPALVSWRVGRAKVEKP